MPQFEVGELAASGAGGKAGETVPVLIDEPQLGAGVRAFLADDHPMPFGHDDRSRRPVSSAIRAGPDRPVAVTGRSPRPGGNQWADHRLICARHDHPDIWPHLREMHDVKVSPGMIRAREEFQPHDRHDHLHRIGRAQSGDSACWGGA